MRNQRFHHSIHMTTLYHNLATTESLRNLIHIYSNNTIHWTQISTHNDIAYISTIQYEEKTVSTLKRNICNITPLLDPLGIKQEFCLAARILCSGAYWARITPSHFSSTCFLFIPYSFFLLILYCLFLFCTLTLISYTIKV